MDANDYMRQHAAAQKRLTESWHRHAANPTMEAQQRARDTEAKAKSDALQRATDYRRDLAVDG